MTKHIYRNQILIGDACEQLTKLATASIDTVITSPPYFGLRNYGVDGQIGLSRSVDGWVDQVLGVCGELARVLKPSGSLWLNLGDSFSNHPRQGAPFKSLLLGPQRLAHELIRQDWIVRNQIIWAKPNSLPSSVRDRLSCTYEIILLLVRSRYYFFDLDAIRAPATSPRSPRRARGNPYPPPPAQPPKEHGVNRNLGLNTNRALGQPAHPLGKNPGDVWTLSPGGFRGAHFATFPLRLIERPLLATCPEKVCAACGAPWRRQPVDRDQPIPTLGRLTPGCDCCAATKPGVVLDPFMGSGTVALAAERHGRDWLGIELNPDFVELAMQRLERERQHER